MSYRVICENRAGRKFTNLEVLNSYQIGKDGVYYFYEVILVDPRRPEISKTKDLKWTTSKKNKNRSLRGLTSAGKKSRGLRSSQFNKKKFKKTKIIRRKNKK